MMEEEDMEIEHVFVAYEIDLNYEFDAARFFDFCQDETPAEASQAQLWFQTARTYPPSPFVTKLVAREDIILGNVNASQKSKYLGYTSFLDDNNSIVPLGMEFSDSVIDDRGLKAVGGEISGLLGGYLQNGAKQPLQVTTGLTFCGMTINDSLNSKAKSAVPKSSTLLKPTASQLAKEKGPLQIVGSRFQKLLAQNRERNLSISSGIASQAAKRQKLEGGLLHKVADVKRQFNFVHKALKKVVTVEQNCTCHAEAYYSSRA